MMSSLNRHYKGMLMDCWDSPSNSCRGALMEIKYDETDDPDFDISTGLLIIDSSYLLLLSKKRRISLIVQQAIILSRMNKEETDE